MRIDSLFVLIIIFLNEMGFSFRNLLETDLCIAGGGFPPWCSCNFDWSSGYFVEFKTLDAKVHFLKVG